MGPSKKTISTEDLKRLYLISKILKLQNPQPLNTCREDLLINGYLPDIDAEEASMSAVENLLSDDSFDYYQEFFIRGPFTIHQPLELLINTVENLFSPNIQVKSCSGRASTSTGRNVNANSGRNSSMGTSSIRTKSSAPGSVAGRTTLSTEEKQVKRSGVGFFHRTNDKFYTRNGGFESSSGSDDTSSSTAGDETDDEGLQQGNRKNISQITKKMQPITYVSRAPQGRRNTVRNGSLPNRPSQKETTSRPHVNSINKVMTKSSTSINQIITATTKPRSTSAINTQRRSTPVFNAMQSIASTSFRSSSANPGASQTSGKNSAQKTPFIEKATQKEKLSDKSEVQNEQQAKEKEIAILATTLDQISTTTTPPYACEPSNYTAAERTNECQEALTLAEKTENERMQPFPETSEENNSQMNQNEEMDSSSGQMNKHVSNNMSITATTSYENMNNFVNQPLIDSLSYQVFLPSKPQRLMTEEEILDGFEVMEQHANPKGEQCNLSQQPTVNPNQQKSQNLNPHSIGEEQLSNPTFFHHPSSHHHSQNNQNIIQQQRPNSEIYVQHSQTAEFQNQQHIYESPPQHISQPTSHDNYHQQLQQQQLIIQASPSFQQQISPPVQQFQSPQMYQKPPYATVSTSMPPPNPLPSCYTINQFNAHHQPNNVTTLSHLPPNWTTNNSPEFYASPLPVASSSFSQSSSPNVTNALTTLSHRSPQVFDGRSPQFTQQQSSQLLQHPNPSTSMQFHNHHTPRPPYSSPPEAPRYMNSPATPMSNSHPSPLPPPPPYPINSGLSNYTNGSLPSINMANANLVQEQQLQQQRMWEQQQFMTQQASWYQNQHFKSPHHPPIDPIQPGPGMYSVPPNCYGYPTPNGSRINSKTPSKTSETPKKISPKENTGTLAKLLEAPSRMPQAQSTNFQHHRQQNPHHIYPQPGMVPFPRQRYPMVNPQMMQQQPHSGNMQPQYYMVPANLPSNMQISSHHQQIIDSHQAVPISLPPRHQQYTHPASVPQLVQFQQLSLSSPQQLQQPLSQPEQIITSPQQQNHPQIISHHNIQQAPALLQQHLQQPQQQNLQTQQHINPRYSNSGSEQFVNNSGASQINSPYSNRSFHNSSAPSFHNSAPFYPSNNMSTSGSPGNLEFSPTNPQLTNRLSNFNTALLSNPVRAISPYTSPTNFATIAPSPPKTPKGKRFYVPNNSESGNISNKKKQSSTFSTAEQIIPTNSSTFDSRIGRPLISDFQTTSQPSNTSFASTRASQNISYTAAFNQQNNSQLKAGLQEHSSPFAEANNFYNCPTFDGARAKEPVITKAKKNYISGIVQNSELHNSSMTNQPSLLLSDASEIRSNVAQIIPTSTEQLTFSTQNVEFDEVDPCEEFLDPEVINERTQEFSSSNALQDSKTLETDKIVEPVIENNNIDYDAERDNAEETGTRENFVILTDEHENLMEETEVEKELEENSVQRTEVLEQNFNPTNSIPTQEPEIEKDIVTVSNSSMTNLLQDTVSFEIGEIIEPVVEKTVFDGEDEGNVLQKAETLEEFAISKAEHENLTTTEKQEDENRAALISSNAEELEEGEIAESPENVEQEEANSDTDKKIDDSRKRSREFDADEIPIIEEKRKKIASEIICVNPEKIQDADIVDEELVLAKNFSECNVSGVENITETSEQTIQNTRNIDEEVLLADSPIDDAIVTPSELNTKELDETCGNANGDINVQDEPQTLISMKIGEEELLLADSPEPLIPATIDEAETSLQPNASTVEENLGKEIRSQNIIDEKSFLADTPTEEPLEENVRFDERDLAENALRSQEDETIWNENILDENEDVLNEVEMLDLTRNSTPPSYAEMMQYCDDVENDELLAKFGANAAMDATATICTLNIIRNEIHKVIADLSAATSIEQSVMINLVNGTVDSNLAEMKERYLSVLNIIDKNLQNILQSNGLKSAKHIEGAFLEVVIPLYTAAINWEKIKNKGPQYYLNIKCVKNLLLSMIAKFGSNNSINIWNELFTLQMFSTTERLSIFHRLLTKSINICNFLEEYFALINDLFKTTQFAAALFIKDSKDMEDSRLANAIIGAAKRVQELSPELRSRIVTKFQSRIQQFLQKFENNNILPEANLFVATLSWDIKTLSDSQEVRRGYFLHPKKLNPTVDKIFKETLKTLKDNGAIKLKRWTYNLTTSILKSNFMSKIIRNSSDLEPQHQEALFNEIIPTLVKLILSVPHLFVAADPYHALELVPTIFEDALPILNEADNESMVVPFWPFATIMNALKNYTPQNTTSLLKSCRQLYLALKKAPINIPEAIQAERRRCSRKIYYQKFHREYVRRQMAKSDIKKYNNVMDRLDLKRLHALISRLFTTKSLECPPKIIVGIKEGDQEAVSTEKVFRAEMMSNCCEVLGDVLNAIMIQDKLEFIVDHPLLNESLYVSDILNVHQFGKDPFACFISFLGLLSLPDNKILNDAKCSAFFNTIKQRRNAIYYFAIKNSALIKNKKPQIPVQILEKDIPIYDILVKLFVNAEMKRILCCPDNVSAYLYFMLIIHDIPGININFVSEKLFKSCGITAEKVEFFATANFAKDLEIKIEKLMNKELESLVKDISSRVNTSGIPRITYHELSSNQSKIIQLKCLVVEICATFWNPHKLLTAVGLNLECRKSIELGIQKLGKLLVTGFYHMGKNVITVEELQSMILEEMMHIQGYGFIQYESFSLHGFVLHIQKLFGFESIISSLLIVLYIFTISSDKQMYAHRITLAHQISREPELLKLFGLENSELASTGIINGKDVLAELENLFEQDYILHASESDPEIFYMFLDQPFNIQYKELAIALESDCRQIKHRFPFHVNNQRNKFHPNEVVQHFQNPDFPLTHQFLNGTSMHCKEVPANFIYFPR